jgi:hypothetical protein
MDKKGTPLPQLFEDFLLAKRSAGCSAKTVSWYRDNLTGYLRFLQEEGEPPVLRSFTGDSVRRFTVHLQARRVKYGGKPPAADGGGGAVQPYGLRLRRHSRRIRHLADLDSREIVDDPAEGATKADLWQHLKGVWQSGHSP